ncbi:MAG: putative maltokinase [Bacteroidota bacterium]
MTIPNLKIENWKQLNTFQQVLEEEILPTYLPKCRWYRSKAKSINRVHVFPFPSLSDSIFHLLRLRVEYMDATSEEYLLPLSLLQKESAAFKLTQIHPQAILAKMEGENALVIDAIYDENFRTAIFEAIQNSTSVSNENGTIRCEIGSILKNNRIPLEEITSKVLNAEQSNTSIIYNEQYFLKIFRKLEYGLNPDLEVVRFLSEKTAFNNAPSYGGSLLFLEEKKRPVILGLIQNKIDNRGDAWSTMLEDLSSYYERVTLLKEQKTPKLLQKERLYFMDVPAKVRHLIGRATYKRVTNLAKRTAEMHIALASDELEDSFIPCDFCQEDQERLYKNQVQLVNDQLNALQHQLHVFPKLIAEEAQNVINQKSRILQILENIIQAPIAATQTRVHGDYHLGQVLDNGEDFYIIDFEGEPMRLIEERRSKTSPFKDVAGMVRSFHYAAYGELYLHPEKYAQDDLPTLEKWAAQWFHYISRFYLTAYFDRTENQGFIPKNKVQLQTLLRTFIIEKAIYEVGYEMNNRPNWLKIPLRGVLYELQ